MVRATRNTFFIINPGFLATLHVALLNLRFPRLPVLLYANLGFYNFAFERHPVSKLNKERATQSFRIISRYQSDL